jgi:polyhydroxybutyrate depolymerase
MTRPIALLPLGLALACGGGRRLELGPCEDTFAGPAQATCDVPAWDDRAYDLVLPDSYDGTSPIPVVVAFHGGGGNRTGAARTTCPTGDVREPECLHELGRVEGFAVVYPDGVPGKGLLKESRTWNAGGGVDGWRCTSGRACEEDRDDIRYIRAMLDDLERRVAVDPERIYATGLSNGGAISHRVACEASDRFAAIAPIGGAMQLTTSDACEPERPVPVLQIHGTDDPCWVYEGGESECPVGQRGLKHVPVARTMDEWAAINGCSDGSTTAPLPDPEDDGTTTVRQTWTGCLATTEHLRIDGGGHLWPNGLQYLGERTVGVTPRDWGNEVIWAFFEAHPKTPGSR